MERDSSFASRPPDLASFESSSPPLVSANKDARHRGVRRVLRAGFHAPFQDFGFQAETDVDTYAASARSASICASPTLWGL
jgi:hypothetical protein